MYKPLFGLAVAAGFVASSFFAVGAATADPTNGVLFMVHTPRPIVVSSPLNNAGRRSAEPAGPACQTNSTPDLAKHMPSAHERIVRTNARWHETCRSHAVGAHVAEGHGGYALKPANIRKRPSSIIGSKKEAAN
jgi:hypothetical protein